MQSANTHSLHFQTNRIKTGAASPEERRSPPGHRGPISDQLRVRRVRCAVAVRGHRAIRESRGRAHGHVHHTRAW